VQRALDANSPHGLLVAPVTYRYLTPYEHGALMASPSIINFTEYIGKGATGMALRGSWYGASVVAKHSVPRDTEALAREALLYKHHLAHLRGIIVPEFLGLYHSDGWSLLVLEDVGSTIKPTAESWEGWSERDASPRSPSNTLPLTMSSVPGSPSTAPFFLIHMAGLAHEDFWGARCGKKRSRLADHRLCTRARNTHVKGPRVAKS
jgi:hypothetical protein